MIITLDGNRLDHGFDDDSTLQAVLDQVRSDLDENRLIVAVAINGEHCNDATLSAALDVPLHDEIQVDLETADRTVLVASALRGAAQELDQTAEKQPQIGELLNAGRVAEAISQIGEFVRTWQLCQTAIVQCSGLLGLDLTKREFRGRTVEDYLVELVNRLKEVRDGLDARDMVMVGDLIQYELPGLCETWRDLLNYLADELGQ